MAVPYEAVKWWKWLGLAGVLSAAAVGVVVVRQRRRRDWVEYEPEELRNRLHARLAASAAGSAGDDPTAQTN